MTSAILFVPFPGEIFGDANNNTLTGTNGNDVFQGFGGNDTINGGLGNDRSVYTDATGGITVDLAAGTVTGLGVGTDTLIGIEQIQGSNFADHYSAAGFTGVSGVPGTPAGFNSFEGMGGDDVIVGAVNIQGQMLTRISYASATAAVTVDIAAGTATGNASVGSDSFINVNAVVGSAFNDVLRGSDNPNGTYEQYEGRAGDDLIDGRGGYDFAVYNNDPTTTSGITVNLAAGTWRPTIPWISRSAQIRFAAWKPSAAPTSMTPTTPWDSAAPAPMPAVSAHSTISMAPAVTTPSSATATPKSNIRTHWRR